MAEATDTLKKGEPAAVPCDGGTLSRICAPHPLLETLYFCLVSFLILYTKTTQIFWVDHSLGSLPMFQPPVADKIQSLRSYSPPP